ncbi:MAG: superoxide dismutase family protein [Methyloligellaceae bacterium]
MKQIVLAAAIVIAAPAAAQAASAVIKSADGQELGTLSLTQTAKGVRISGTLRGLEPGVHGFHIHAVGKCEPPFKSAGGHFNPHNVAHGKGEGGPHAGDMENIAVLDSGPVTIDVTNPRVTLNPHGKHSLFDADGSAIIFHANADDYVSQPSGAAGPRVACGVVQ